MWGGGGWSKGNILQPLSKEFLDDPVFSQRNKLQISVLDNLHILK